MRNNRSAWQDREAAYGGAMRLAAPHDAAGPFENRKRLEECVVAELDQARTEWRAADRAYWRLAGAHPSLPSMAQQQIRQAAAKRAAAVRRFNQALDLFTQVLLDRNYATG